MAKAKTATSPAAQTSAAPAVQASTASPSQPVPPAATTNPGAAAADAASVVASAPANPLPPPPETLEAPEATPKRYTVLTTLVGLGKKPAQPGSVVELDDESAQPLLACKAIAAAADSTGGD